MNPDLEICSPEDVAMASEVSQAGGEDFYTPSAMPEIDPGGVPEDFYGSGNDNATEVKDDYFQCVDNADTQATSVSGDEHLAAAAIGSADVGRFLQLYDEYRSGHIPTGMSHYDFYKFREFIRQLEQDPDFRELYSRYQDDRLEQLDRWSNETIIDSHGHVGPRWQVDERDYRELKQAQLGTLTSAGPFSLLGMLITYVRTGDVDEAIEVGSELKAWDGLAKGISKTAPIQPPVSAADPAGQPAERRAAPDRADPIAPDLPDR
jgi:hypothetical protein